MINTSVKAVIEQILAAGVVQERDVLALRQALYTATPMGGDEAGLFSDGTVSREEVALLLQIQHECTIQAPQPWADFLLEAVTDIMLEQGRPKRYISQEEASWLIDEIQRDGKLSSSLELSLLLHLISRAEGVHESLKTYVLTHIATIIIKGEGVSLSGHQLTPGVVDDTEVDMLQKAIYGPGGTGGINISADEAGLLFAIDGATSEAANSKRWPTLFANAMSAHVMGYIINTETSEQEATRREKWLESDGQGKFMNRMLGSILTGEAFLIWLRRDSGVRPNLAELGAAAAEKVTAKEQIDLYNLLWQDGRLSLAEQALLSKLRELQPDLAAVWDKLLTPP